MPTPTPDRAPRLDPDLAPVAAAVRTGLTGAGPRSLPPWLFYDARGSQLFEEITELPEYYLTRAERSVFEASADDIIAAAGPCPLEVVELGAGTATKSEILLAALARVGGGLYLPIDVSAVALAEARTRLVGRVPGIDIRPRVADHDTALAQLVPRRRLILFIGSSLGNFDDDDAVALLRRIRSRLTAGGSLLLGLDRTLDPAVLLPAYDDAAGVTAAFNKNLLHRLNRELDADFDVDRWDHLAGWNPDRSRIEIYLRARGAQRVRIAALDLTVDFADGETIHTESSHKYADARTDKLLARADLVRDRTWRDADDRFGVHLCRPRA